MRRCGVLVLVLVRLLVLTVQAQSPAAPALQQPFFHNLTYADGLLGGQMMTIAQDAKGFMWFGFTDGVQRYDGEKFVTYPYLPKFALQPGTDAHSLSSIAPSGSLERFDLLTGRFHPLPKGETGDRKTYTDAGGRPWRLFNRLLQPAQSGRLFRNGFAYLTWPGGPTAPVRIIADESTRQVWVYDNDNELFLLDEKTDRLYSPLSNADAVPLFATVKGVRDWVRGATMDATGNLWVFTWTQDFLRYNTRNKTLHGYRLADVLKSQGAKNLAVGYVTDVLCDRQGAVWLATSKAGLLRHDAATESFPALKADLKNSHGLHYNFDVMRLFQDREDNIWVGTDKGVSHFNPYRQRFTVLRHQEDAAPSLPDDEITDAVETEEGKVLVATWGGGIGVYDKDKRYSKTLRFDSLRRNQVWCFAKRGDAVAAGCQYAVIHLLGADGSLQKTFKPPALPPSTISCMVNDAQGNTWLGLNDGTIAFWKAGSEDFTVFNTTGKVGEARQAAVRNLFIDRSEKVWMACANGLKLFDPATQSLTGHYQPQGGAFPPGIIPSCCAVEEWNDSLLLVGFENLGLCFFNRKAKTFTPVTIEGDARPQSVYAVKKDETGTVWISTAHELLQWQVPQRKFIRSSPEKGVLNGTFFYSRFHPTRGGDWLTFTQSEVLFFKPGEMRQPSSAQEPVTITGFNVFGKPVAVDSLFAAAAPVTLSYQQNFFTVDFATLQFYRRRGENYAYRLVGLNNDWTSSNGKRLASYTGLPPGDYRFEVRAEGGEKVTSFALNIKPAFWQTTAFKIVSLALFAFAVFAFVRWRIRTVKREAGLKQRMAETEMAALRAQMNPHFIFNCINSIDALIQGNDKYNATVYLNKFAKLIRNILDSSKQNTVPLTKDLETLRLYVELEQFRNENKFAAEVKADAQLLQDDFRVPPLIVQPYVENAIQHGLRHRMGADGKLSVTVSRENGSLVYNIEDNGVGRSHATLTSTDRSHYGLQMSGDRVKLFNGERTASVEITDLKEGEEAKGTRVRVWLKV